MRTAALERVVRRVVASTSQPPAGCDMCAGGVEPHHRHALDVRSRELMCLCRACGLLFSREAASGGHYRLVPQRRVRLVDVAAEVLGVPVGMAYFVLDDAGDATAHYPSPLGATRWDIDPTSWSAVVDGCPPLAGLQPEVEALLVNTTRGARQSWLVPIDDCFALNALVRAEWRGLSGGDRIWPAIETFFAELEGGARG